ncbi:MAG: phospholipase D-like domain-containing protein [Syntrophaceae bacterium]|nr:phospholipase D-like domain-containing protein [Syntrophaceae bacterium]
MEMRGYMFFRVLTLGILAGFLLTQGCTAAPAGEKGRPDGGNIAACNVEWLADGDYFPALLEAIDQAQEELWLTAFFFKTNGFQENRPDQVLSSLQAAAGRGIAVTVLFEQGSDGDQVSRENRQTAGRLRHSGVRVCFDTPKRTTHAKLLVVDGRLLLVGSHNLTQSALKYNHEVSVRIQSQSLAEEALRYLRPFCP